MHASLSLRVTLCLSLSLVWLTGDVAAQTLYGVDGPGGLVIEYAGPPPFPGAFPNGPVVSFWSFVKTFACPAGPGTPAGTSFSLAPFDFPGTVGDVAVDRGSDTLWVTDGGAVMEFDRFGVPLSAFQGGAISGGSSGVLTGAITGLEASGGDLWITDGTSIALLTPPPGSCYAPSVKMLFSASPMLTTGTITDLTWDPTTGTLWTCNDLGLITNIDISPVLLGLPPVLGPSGSIVVAPSAAFGLGPALTGMAWNTAQDEPAFYLTDGCTMAHLTLVGASVVSAPSTFYTPTPSYSLFPDLFSGIAFSARPITFGTGTGLEIGVTGVGQFTTPNALFGLTMTGATPSALGAFLFVGVPGPAPVFIMGSPLYIMGTVLGPFPVGALSGSVTLFPIAIDAGIPLSLWAAPALVALQWAVLQADGTIAVSPGLNGYIALP
jgi:hypothetical protein